MKIYKVERTDKWSYDHYDSFVCFANSEEEARYLAPDPEYHIWKDGKWCYSYREQAPATYVGWTEDPNSLKITELIDPMLEGKPEVILASFNPG